jgi:hypothetical protein
MNMISPRHDSLVINGRSISDVLEDMVTGWRQERIALGALLDALGDRGFGVLIILLALPNFLPFSIPGFSALTGLPVAFFAAQLALGQRQPWLPRFLLNRSVSAQDFAAVVLKFLPTLRRCERWVRPRLTILTTGVGERVIGVVAIALAVLLALPIPFGNPPPAIALALLAIGVIERDGGAVIAGYVMGLAAFVLVGALVFGVFTAGTTLLGFV